MYMKCLATNFKKPRVRFSGSAFNPKACQCSFLGKGCLWIGASFLLTSRNSSYFASPEKMKKCFRIFPAKWAGFGVFNSNLI